MANITKKGARSVTQTLDRVASLLQQDWRALGVPQKVAHDFAYRCDLLSDHIEKKAGLKRGNFDAEEIGVEKKGPLEAEPDEPYMKGEFSQQENRELRERVEDADLGMTPNPEPQAPSSGKQAFARVGKLALSNSLGTSIQQIQGAAVRLGAKNPKVAGNLCALAASIQQAQKGLLTGKTSAVKSARILEAVKLLSLDNPSTKLANMVDLAIKVAEEEDTEEEKEPEASKKAADEDEEEGGEEEEKTEAGKKANHGFNLFA